ncbi:MAG: biotin transporter BioY [Spirochaetaceae bacterium]|nr:MAG: biotin transporter BioY [Spirochaetaceae bacterium]
MTTRTYADLIKPNSRLKAFLFDIILVTSVSFIMALSSAWRIGWPVPITMQTFIVLFSAMLLGARRSAVSVGLFMLYGLTQMPWYLGGSIAGPTGGYIIGFFIASLAVGHLAESGMDRKYYTAIVTMILGNIIIYIFGVLQLSFFIKENLFGVGVLPFIPGDLIKIAAASLMLPTGWKILKKI